MTQLIIVAAHAKNRVIGKDNQLCWHLPEDLAHFKALTQGRPVIMGRKTWESLPASVRPLPGRLNIVVSRQADYALPAGVLRATSLSVALELAGAVPEVCVIGGAQLYREALPLAHRLELTEVDLSPEGDAYFPNLEGGWQAADSPFSLSKTGIRYRVRTWRRVPAA